MEKAFAIAAVLSALALGLAGADELRPAAPAESVRASGTDASPLEFLADLPQLKGVSLKMPEKDLRALLARQKLHFERSARTDGGAEYTVQVPLKDWIAEVIFGFGKVGTCTGIQRMPSSPRK